MPKQTGLLFTALATEACRLTQAEGGEWTWQAPLALSPGGYCDHPEAVPVELLVTGDLVAWLCPDCDVQLPAEWAVQDSTPSAREIPSSSETAGL